MFIYILVVSENFVQPKGEPLRPASQYTRHKQFDTFDPLGTYRDSSIADDANIRFVVFFSPCNHMIWNSIKIAN